MTTRLETAIVATLILTSATLAQSGKAGASKGNGTTQTRPRYIPYGPYGGPGGRASAILPGHNPRVRVQQPPRLDWAFALPGSREVGLHDSTQTIYQLWVPTTYRHAVPNPLLLFFSAKAAPDEWPALDILCRKYGILLAIAYEGGDGVTPGRRMRLALDVLDDLRRRMAVDTDRVYVAGFSEGARTACELAYAYPEFVGGVLAIGGASSPRPEPWLRQRMKERLSIALMTGQASPVRGEMELVRFPVLRDLGAEARIWSVPGLGHAMPPLLVFEEALLWLDSKQVARKQLAVRYPMSRVRESVVLPAELWAAGVVEEAQLRLKERKGWEAGILQLEGVARRWRGTEAARVAEKRLDSPEVREKERWQVVFDRAQQEYYHLEAKALDAYVTGQVADQEVVRKKVLGDELANAWEQVRKHGEDTEAGRRATARLAELRKPAVPR